MSIKILKQIQKRAIKNLGKTRNCASKIEKIELSKKDQQDSIASQMHFQRAKSC